MDILQHILNKNTSATYKNIALSLQDKLKAGGKIPVKLNTVRWKDKNEKSPEYNNNKDINTNNIKNSLEAGYNLPMRKYNLNIPQGANDRISSYTGKRVTLPPREEDSFLVRKTNEMNQGNNRGKNREKNHSYNTFKDKSSAELTKDDVDYDTHDYSDDKHYQNNYNKDHHNDYSASNDNYSAPNADSSVNNEYSAANDDYDDFNDNEVVTDDDSTDPEYYYYYYYDYVDSGIDISHELEYEPLPTPVARVMNKELRVKDVGLNKTESDLNLLNRQTLDIKKTKPNSEEDKSDKNVSNLN